MATLSGQTIANTFDSLLHVEDDTAGLVATSTDSRVIQDGVGANSALALATDSVRITSTNKLYFNDVGGEYISGDGTDLTITSGNDIVLAVGSGGSAYCAGAGGTSNTVFGFDAGDQLASNDNYNTFIGHAVATADMTAAVSNTGLGYVALTALTEGDNNTAIGAECGTALEGGGNNTIVGFQAGDAMTNNNDNTIVGKSAFSAANSGENYNTIIGMNAGLSINDTGSDNNVIIGYNAGIGGSAAMDANIIIGSDALNSTAGTALGYCVAIGVESLTNAANANNNGTVSIGYQSMYTATNTALNSSVGYQSLKFLDTGDGNTAFGNQAGRGSGGAGTYERNTLIGYRTGFELDTGDDNVCIGYNAGFLFGANSQNVVIGAYAMEAEDDNADGNVAIGYKSLTDLNEPNSHYNIAIGHNAMFTASTGNHADNIAIGQAALDATGANAQVGTIAIGKNALGALTDGASNIGIGYGAGVTLQTGSENIIIGYDTNPATEDNTNNIVIGDHLTATDKDNAVFLGNNTNHIENDFNADATWNFSSDMRQKKDIKDDSLGLLFINDLRPVTYKHKSPSEFPKEWTAYDSEDKEPMGGDKTMHGLIAQEVKEALDKQNIDTFAGWSVGDDGRQRISAEKMVFPLIKAVQELSQQVEDLKKQIN